MVDLGKNFKTFALDDFKHSSLIDLKNAFVWRSIFFEEKDNAKRVLTPKERVNALQRTRLYATLFFRTTSNSKEHVLTCRLRLRS